MTETDGEGEHSFWKHFFIGLLLGATLSLAFAAWLDVESGPMIGLTALGAMTMAVIAGFYGEEFWAGMKKTVEDWFYQ